MLTCCLAGSLSLQVLSPGALKPGATYTLRLTATQPDSASAGNASAPVLSGYADVTLVVAGAPRLIAGAASGLSVSPAAGIAMARHPAPIPSQLIEIYEQLYLRQKCHLMLL